FADPFGRYSGGLGDGGALGVAAHGLKGPQHRLMALHLETDFHGPSLRLGCSPGRYFTVQRHPVLTERQPKNADTLAAEPHNVVESHLCRQEQPKEIQSHRPPDSPATWETHRPMQASVGDPHDHTSLLRRRAHQL